MTRPSLTDTALNEASWRYVADAIDVEQLEAEVEVALRDPWEYMCQRRPHLREQGVRAAEGFYSLRKPTAESRRELLSQAQAIAQAAASEGRAFTKAEEQAVRSLFKRADELTGALTAREKQLRALADAKRGDRVYWWQLLDGNRPVGPRIQVPALIAADGRGFAAAEPVRWQADHRCTVDAVEVWDAQEGGLLLGTPEVCPCLTLEKGHEACLTEVGVRYDHPRSAKA